MDVKARNGPSPGISLPEQQPTIEYWWEPGSSSSGLSFLSYIYMLAKNWWSCKPPNNSLENMDGRKSIFHNESVSPLSLMTHISSVTPNTHILPRRRKWKFNIHPPPPLNLESIEEERGLSEYDCGYLDLGAETPNTSHSHFMQNLVPFHIPARRRTFRRASPVSMNRLSKYAVDRDCGIWYAECAIFWFWYWTQMCTVLNMLLYHVGLCAVERFFAPNI